MQSREGWQARPTDHYRLFRATMQQGVDYPCGRLLMVSTKQAEATNGPTQRYRVSCGAERARLAHLIISFRFSFRFGHSGFYNNPFEIQLKVTLAVPRPATQRRQAELQGSPLPSATPGFKLVELGGV